MSYGDPLTKGDIEKRRQVVLVWEARYARNQSEGNRQQLALARAIYEKKRSIGVGGINPGHPRIPGDQGDFIKWNSQAWLDAPFLGDAPAPSPVSGYVPPKLILPTSKLLQLEIDKRNNNRVNMGLERPTHAPLSTPNTANLPLIFLGGFIIYKLLK